MPKNALSLPSPNPYGWVIVAAGALMGCVSIGAMFSLAVFLDPITTSTGWSRTGVSSAMTLNFLTMGVAGFAWGVLSDRFGARIVVLAGAVLLGLALVLASRATSQLEFLLIYGLLVGVSTGSFFAPMIALTSGWFERHRALAVSLVSAGVGVAPMTVSPFTAWLLMEHGWREAQWIIGLVVWALLIPAAFFVRPPPQASAGQQAGVAAAQPSMSAAQALHSPQFIILALVFFACCATHAGPIFHTISYAVLCGIPMSAAVTIYSLEGLSGLFGRIAFGVMADRFGVKRVLIGGLLLQAVAAGAFIYAVRLQGFYAVALFFGFAYGGVMPLYAVLAREYFGQRIMGTVLGAATMISAFGMALGPSAGGWIFDTWGSYRGMYIGSFVLGLIAVAIALAFPPFPRAPRRVQPA
jgi:MFS family permease